MKNKILRFAVYCMLCFLCSCNSQIPGPSGKAELSVPEKTLSDMSLSEKIYQMIFTTPEDITGAGCVTKAGETTKTALLQYPVGGLVYFSNNLKDRTQVINMLKNTQTYSKIPLFLGVDEEGGTVARVGSNPALNTTGHPTMAEIGATQDAKKAYNIGKTLATDLKALGFNLDFAPVADVLINENNTEIGSRSFGTEPNLVALMVENTVCGLEDNGVSSVLKHFPGHGSTAYNSHLGYSESLRTEEELKNSEFIPFKAGIEAGADFVMISHMTLPNTEPGKLPCSLSYKVITQFLKKELDFQGIVITDSFKMGAITNSDFSERPEVLAIKAGVDMILMPQNVKQAHDAILDAVTTGKITEDRINESVLKILSKKYESGLLKNE